MATRPVFLPESVAPFWKSSEVHFEWHAGFAISQKQKSIDSFHDAALDSAAISRPLEVSSKSTSSLGTSLSAFRLRVSHNEFGDIALESAFQGSKVFSQSGQLAHAYSMDPRDAKSEARGINETEQLVGFRWGDKDWPLEPKSWFYDWLFMTAVLHSMPEAPSQIRRYDAFTDIEFNPKKSFNCQARSCAIIAASESDEQLREWIESPDLLIGRPKQEAPIQSTLFLE